MRKLSDSASDKKSSLIDQPKMLAKLVADDLAICVESLVTVMTHDALQIPRHFFISLTTCICIFKFEALGPGLDSMSMHWWATKQSKKMGWRDDLPGVGLSLPLLHHCVINNIDAFLVCR